MELFMILFFLLTPISNLSDNLFDSTFKIHLRLDSISLFLVLLPLCFCRLLKYPSNRSVSIHPNPLPQSILKTEPRVTLPNISQIVTPLWKSIHWAIMSLFYPDIIHNVFQDPTWSVYPTTPLPFCCPFLTAWHWAHTNLNGFFDVPWTSRHG